MGLIKTLQDNLVAAQKAKDEVVVATLRFLLSSVHNAQIQKGEELTEEEIVAQIRREVKRHIESIDAFKTARRDELVASESAEKTVLEKYLPQGISDQELSKVVDEAIKEVGAQTAADFGKVMGVVMNKVGGEADGARVSAQVKAKLS